MSVERLKVAVLGAGSFGTAMAYVAAHNDHNVVIYCRSIDQAEGINKNHRNIKRLKETELPHNIRATNDLKSALEGASLILHCIPAQITPDFVKSIRDMVPSGVPYVSTSKGIHVKSRMLMSEAITEAFGERAKEGVTRAEIPLAYLSGPSFAAEMVKNHPMSVVVASHDQWCANRVQQLLTSKYFRIYTSDDVIGVEIGGALKNPLAIGAGVAQGLGFGQSTVAGIVTRGCQEMKELSLSMGGRDETLAGLSGVGDLMLTCYSSLSRNNRFGSCLARGLSPEEACDEIGEVVEGYPTALEVIKIAQERNMKLPLFTAVAKMVSGEKSPKEVMSKMMNSTPGKERHLG